MERFFCPSCGNKTLMKVAVTIADDGTIQYHYPKRKRNFNIRGTKVPLLLDMFLLFFIAIFASFFRFFYARKEVLFLRKVIERIILRFAYFPYYRRIVV